MKISFSFIFILFFLSCTTRNLNREIKNQTQLFSYQDGTGLYYFKRFVKKDKSKLIVKTLLYTPSQEKLPLEKTISVTRFVSNKREMRLLPDVSQFTIWLEKKKHFVQHKTDIKSKSLQTIINNAGERKSLTTLFPKTKNICNFSQLPECLQVLGLFGLDMGESLSFDFLFEASPFHQEQYVGFNDQVFYSAIIRREDNRGGFKRYSIELNGQLLFLEFSLENEFTNIFWIAQGITIQRLRG